MLTEREKDLLLNLLSQLSFKVGESEVAKEYEAMIIKLKQPAEKPAVEDTSVLNP